MADIFVSHSQKDREQVRLLAAFLEAEGYTVWWDKNLETADDFSEEVLKQLDLAKAVIVVWTENSVGSQFVRAECCWQVYVERWTLSSLLTLLLKRWGAQRRRYIHFYASPPSR